MPAAAPSKPIPLRLNAPVSTVTRPLSEPSSCAKLESTLTIDGALAGDFHDPAMIHGDDMAGLHALVTLATVAALPLVMTLMASPFEVAVSVLLDMRTRGLFQRDGADARMHDVSVLPEAAEGLVAGSLIGMKGMWIEGVDVGSVTTATAGFCFRCR